MYYNGEECDVKGYAIIESIYEDITVQSSQIIEKKGNKTLYELSFHVGEGVQNLESNITSYYGQEPLTVVFGTFNCSFSENVNFTLINNHQIDFKLGSKVSDKVFFKVLDTTNRNVDPADFICESMALIPFSCTFGRVDYSDYYYLQLDSDKSKSLILEESFTIQISYPNKSLEFTIYPFENQDVTMPTNPQSLGYQDVSSTKPLPFIYVTFQNQDSDSFSYITNSQSNNISYNVFPISKLASIDNVLYLAKVPYEGTTSNLLVGTFYLSTSPSEIDIGSVVPIEYTGPIPYLTSGLPIVSNTLMEIGYDLSNPAKAFFYPPYFNQMDFKTVFEYPFGFFFSSTPSVGQWKASFLFSKYQLNLLPNTYFSVPSLNIAIGPVDSLAPSILNIQLSHFSGNYFTFTIQVKDNLSGVNSIQIGTELLTPNNLIQGDIIDGVFQKNIYLPNSEYPLNIIVTDQAYNQLSLDEGDSYSFDATTNEFKTSPLNPFMYLDNKITMVSFEKNLINVSISSENNTVTVGIENPALYSKFPPTFRLFKSITNDPLQVIEKEMVWSNELDLFVTTFSVPKGTIPRDMNYEIGLTGSTYSSKILSPLFGANSKLQVISETFSEMPPLITSCTSQSLVYVSGVVAPTVNYHFSIESGNGFDSGYVIVTSNVDFVGRNLSLSLTSGDEFVGTYSGSFLIRNRMQDLFTDCRNQDYIISYIKLIDKNGYFSEHKLNAPSTAIDPLLYRPTSNSQLCPVTIACMNPPVAPASKPTLVSFSSSVSQEDVNVAYPHNVTFDLILTSDNALSLTQLPVLYLNEVGMRILSFPMKPNVTDLTLYLTNCTYTVTVEIPKGFGINEGIALSIYGASDLYLNIASWSTRDLKASDQEYWLSTVYTPNYDPILLSTSPITSQGGVLTLFGSNFGVFSDDIVSVEISYETIPIKTVWIPVKIISRLPERIVVVIFNIRTDLTKFYIRVKVNLISTSSLEILYPIITPPPNSPPPNVQVCFGTPLCGGDSNGKCISTGCQCIPPWVGKDCLSRTIIIEPNISTTSPEVNSQINDVQGAGNVIKNIVAIDSILEYNFKNELIKNHTFKEWNFTNQTDSNSKRFLYSALINNDTQIPTTVNITIEYFDQDTTIYFANEAVQIQKSTLKYKVQLSPYFFRSSTNSLQLVMSTFIESSNTDSCSMKESGDTTNNNFEYFKLQVDDHSLYGKFIKKAEIDNRILTITNTLLNSDDESSQSEKQSINALIGINIPYYTEYVLMDPDFSLLLDSRSTSDIEDSPCYKSSNDSSKLTKEQLIGIIIASCVVGVLLICTLIYMILRYSNNTILLQAKLKLRSLTKR